jgi:hypothetical protein
MLEVCVGEWKHETRADSERGAVFHRATLLYLIRICICE